MKTLAAVAAVAWISITTARAEPVIALEGEISQVGKTGLRLVWVRWYDPEKRQLKSESGEHYVKIATEGAEFHEGKKVAIYVHDGGTIEWEGRTFKRWNAVEPAKLPKGSRVSFPSDFGSR